MLLAQPARRCLDHAWLRRNNEAQPRYWGLDLAPPAPRCAPLLPADAVCSGHTVYVQVYGPEQMLAAAAFADRLRALGASVPAPEDVVASAERRRRVPPRAYAEVTVLYQSEGENGVPACARALGKPGWRLQELPPGLQSAPGTVEVWWPPVAP
jgi:hypothetical protein